MVEIVSINLLGSTKLVRARFSTTSFVGQQAE